MAAIGVLGLQGDAREHLAMLGRIGVPAMLVRSADDLSRAAGLIIPGGESTVIGKLLEHDGFDKEVARRARAGMPVWGTCAGAILLATQIADSDQPRLGLWEMRIARNAYGRQIASFEAQLDIAGIGSVPALFIRAPMIESCEGDVLARHNGTIVMARNKNLLATTFHPELTDDARVHAYFARMAQQAF
jgi:5'-phosphate synthase pdxT subunit